MKKYRCPHCGEKAFSASQYNFIRLVSDYYTMFGDDHFDILHCSVCSQASKFTMAKQSLRSIEIGLAFIILLTIIFAIYFFTVNIYIGIALLILMLLEMIFEILAKISRVLLPCDKDHDFYRVELPLSNCRVEFNDIKYLKAYGTYAIKFKETTNDLHFNETFPDGLVPIQLYQKIGDSTRFEARIINKKFVSSDLLYDGAKFLIEDNDGIFVAKGSFIKAYFEDELNASTL